MVKTIGTRTVMIPLKIQIKNFLSYGDTQTINFAPYSLICLSGKNGHGKSALLDALTWTLWGSARKITGVAKSDDNLIRIGATHMMVGLQFICNGQEYRVRREYIKSASKPYVTLDVGVLDSQQNLFVSVGGKSIRANQSALNKILHLDFDSFCNSAFLRQGQSNEFSKKSPKERKEILASILGLDQYEAVRALASEKCRQLIAERISMQAVIDRMGADIDQSKLIQEQLAALQEQFLAHEKKELELMSREQLLQVQANTIKQGRQQESILIAEITQLADKECEFKKLLQATVASWRSVHAQQLTALPMEQLEQQKNKLVIELKEYQEAFHLHLQQKEKYLHAKERLQIIERDHEKQASKELEEHKISSERLFRECQQYNLMITSLNQRKEALLIEQVHHNKQAQVMSEQLAQLLETQKKYQGAMAQFEKRKAFYQNWIALGNLLSTELQNSERKKQLCVVDDNPCCPLCEQNLSGSRRRFLKDKLAEQERFVSHRLNRITRVLSQLKEVLIKQHQDLQYLQQQINHYQTLEISRDNAQKKVSELALELINIEQQIDTCQQQEAMIKSAIGQLNGQIAIAQEKAKLLLQTNQEYSTLLALMQSLQQNITSQNFDLTRQHRLVSELENIEKSIKTYHQLTEQKALQAQRMSDIARVISNLKKIKQEKLSLNQRMSQFCSLGESEKELAVQLDECTMFRDQLTKSKELLVHEKGSLVGRMTKLQEIEREQKDLTNKLSELNNRIEDYQAITLAVGKDGIQALLIQDVLPEIEHEANELLGKLTDNQAQIFIESLRDLKKGGTKETLDINISDPMGTRPYEMFSGGEAFRIDFALRIALSKMLARRAGTSLQTLIIDEGFGSQDEEGLANIMDALYKIQDDFAKVIVVSHLTSMKEQFPVHFYVEKKPTGSLVSVIEQE